MHCFYHWNNRNALIDIHKNLIINKLKNLKESVHKNKNKWLQFIIFVLPKINFAILFRCIIILWTTNNFTPLECIFTTCIHSKSLALITGNTCIYLLLLLSFMNEWLNWDCFIFYVQLQMYSLLCFLFVYSYYWILFSLLNIITISCMCVFLFVLFVLFNCFQLL